MGFAVFLVTVVVPFALPLAMPGWRSLLIVSATAGILLLLAFSGVTTSGEDGPGVFLAAMFLAGMQMSLAVGFTVKAAILGWRKLSAVRSKSEAFRSRARLADGLETASVDCVGNGHSET